MALSVHLLSSIAVVGRDNEPIYLRGDLSDIITTTTSSLQLDLDKILHMHNAVFDDHEHDDESSIHDTSTIDADAPHTPREELGEIELLSTPKENNHAINTDTTKEDEDEASDPFGFFNESHHSSSMSLTNQLVLHASLDRFEEMAQSSSGAVRWRMPGSYGANAMWMGRLCEVEERWNVYGYLTNTGIKFMILLENVQINEDGVVRFHHVPILDNQSCLHREAELKNMFSQLHELYVRYTMNPFSKLKSPIQSRMFDEGIREMAREFNTGAIKMASAGSGGFVEDGINWM